MAAWAGGYSLASAALVVDIGASLSNDVANNRTLHKVHVYSESGGTVRYWTDGHPDGWWTNIYGPTGLVHSLGSGLIAYDFRGGSGSRTYHYVGDLWIPHNAAGGGSVYGVAAAGDSHIGSASLNGSGSPLAMPDLYTAPAVPSSPALDQIASTSIRYNATEGATGGTAVLERQLQRATNSGFTTGVVDFAPGSLTNCVVTGLDATTLYYFRSRRRNAFGWSAWSTTVSATTINVPGQPTLTPGTITPHTVPVTVTDPAYTGGTITGREVRISPTESMASIIQALSGLATSFTYNTGLTQHTKYYAQGRVQNSEGWGAWSLPQEVETTGAPLSLMINNDDIWERASLWVNVAGVWKYAKVWTKVGGVWKTGI